MRETVVTQINNLFDLPENAGNCVCVLRLRFPPFSHVFPQIENVRIAQVSCLDSSAFVYDTACAYAKGFTIASCITAHSVHMKQTLQK